MRVLHVTQPTSAGVPVVVRQYAADQVAHGHEVVVASPDDGDLPGWLGADAVPRRSWSAARSPGATVPGEVRRLRRIVADVDPDVVHLHSAKAGLAGRLALRGRRPTVFQPHAWSFEAVDGLVGAASERWERFAVRWTAVTVCVSEDERRRGEAAGVRGDVVVVPNGVDVAGIAPAGEEDRAAARTELGLPTGPLVVCIGRLAPQKGQDLLLSALPGIRARVPGAHLVLVGDGPEAAALRAAAPRDVVFAGHRHDVRRWLVAADVVALPSRWEAGLSLVAMEAMAVGRSVVSTGVAGVGDLLPGAGAVVPLDDVAALTEAVSARLAEPSRAAAEGARGRQAVERHRDVRRTAAQVRAAYEHVLRGGEFR
ncbi:glycosyltransferase [Kineococcus sp. R8]|uniref:glycosyltransferase n=1 Tax=Kineococcus siccus TaxID=2696567 RepID=UPI001412C63F|nr:glycosyltransferase [Kineococcus siccus]NAZ81108.1 glycosyltransferase [Kineococcus siccus]